jgi:hypothetical protein
MAFSAPQTTMIHFVIGNRGKAGSAILSSAGGDGKGKGRPDKKSGACRVTALSAFSNPTRVELSMPG